MPYLNKVIIMGHLGADPDVRQSQSGGMIVNLRIATSRTVKGEKETEWHRIAVFGRAAEIAAKYLHKGDLAVIEGRLHTRKYQAKDGSDRYATEIICENLQLGGKSDDKQQRPQQSRTDPLEEDPPF